MKNKAIYKDQKDYSKLTKISSTKKLFTYKHNTHIYS